MEGFLAQILARQRLRVDLDLGLWYDGNVNNAAEVGTVAIPAFGNLVFEVNQRPVGAWVARTGASLRWREAVTADSARISAWSGAGGAAAATPRTCGEGSLWTRSSTRTGASASCPASGPPGMTASRAGSIPWDGRWPCRSRARETAERSSQNWRSRGLNLTYAADVGEDWRGSVRVGLSAARFDETDAAFLRRREDRTRSVGLTLAHRKVSWEGYQPVLMLDWSQTEPAIPLYDRKLLSFRVGLRRLF